MYGGVAATYCRWKMLGEPFKENKTWYVKMEHPITKLPKKVRWYTDKAHADLMPQSKVAQAFRGAVFGFANKDDYVLCIRDRDLAPGETEQYFHYNWKKGGKWKFGMFFGGVWYAPKDTDIPPIRRADRVFRATWPEFVKAGRANSTKLGFTDGFWHKEVIDE